MHDPVYGEATGQSVAIYKKIIERTVLEATILSVINYSEQLQATQHRL